MVGQSYFPSPELREYVKGYQLWHFVFPDANNLPFKPYAPRPEQTLVFCPRGSELISHAGSDHTIKRNRSYITGQYTVRTNRHIGSTDFIILLVNFHPGVLYRLTGIPYHELTNKFVDAEAIFTNEIRLVNERISSTDDYEEMISIVETFLRWLVQRVKRDAHQLDLVTSLLIDHPENFKLIHLAKESFLCTRQFERKFKERVGVSPKLFARISRTHKAFRMKYQYPDLDWLSVALVCGYEDYQHMAKDFQDLSGLTPKAYLLEDDKSPERHYGVRDYSLMRDVVFLPIIQKKKVSILKK